MRAMTVLTLVSLTLAGAGPVVGQTPTMEQALRRAEDYSPLPLSLARDQADWAESHARLPEGFDPADDIQSRIEALTAQADRDEGLARTIFRDGTPPLGRECAATGLEGCSSPMGGYLVLDGGGLHWQVQEGFTDENGVSGGIVFIGDAGAARMGPTAPIAWSFDGARFEAPILLAGPEFDGKAYIAVPGIRAGSGSGNADVLFRWDLPDTRRLTQIDTWSWRDSLDGMLPEGLEIWQGVRFDWSNMVAFTPLWQAGDGNCCASGGTAILDFEIEGDRLILAGVTVQDAALKAARTVPSAVLDYVGRRSRCADHASERDADAERAEQIRAAMAQLRCASLDGERAILRRTHAGQPRLLALMARAEAPDR